MDDPSSSSGAKRYVTESNFTKKGLVKAMAEAEKRDAEISVEESAKLGVSPLASRQLHGF